MATISDIANASQYHGDSNLSGGGSMVFDLDTKPVQQLATYTYLYNKSQYDQRQKDADQKIKELAELSAYDLTTARGKDKDEVIKRVAELAKAASLYAQKGTPKSPQEKINQEIEFQKQIQEAKKIITSGNARGVAYNLHKSAIEASNDDAGVKAEKIKILDKQFDESDILTTIQAVPNFDLSVPKVSAPVYKTQDAQAIGYDNNVEQTITYFDGPSNDAAALIESGVMTDIMTPPPPGASDIEKQEWDLKMKNRKGNILWQDAAKNFNAALNDPNYKKKITDTVTGTTTMATDEPDLELIKQKNPLAGNIISLAERYNEYANQRNTENWVIDEKGFKVILPNGPDKKLRLIDVKSGLSPRDIVYLEKFSKAEPDKAVSKVTHTGEGSANYRSKINEQGANWRAKLPYTMAKISAGTATTQELENYPVLKTRELYETIGTGAPVAFSTLTPEQQAKIKTQVGELVTDYTSVSIDGGKIKVTGTFKDGEKNTPTVININLDDVTKNYYDEINKNDAGKEAPQRIYFVPETPVKNNTVSPDAYKTDKNTANWQNVGDGNYIYIPTGQKINSKTGKISN